MTTKGKEQRMVTFERDEHGDVLVVVHGDVPEHLVRRIHENRHAILGRLERMGGEFPPTTH